MLEDDKLSGFKPGLALGKSSRIPLGISSLSTLSHGPAALNHIPAGLQRQNRSFGQLF